MTCSIVLNMWRSIPTKNNVPSEELLFWLQLPNISCFCPNTVQYKTGNSWATGSTSTMEFIPFSLFLLAAMWIGMAQVAIGVTSEFICPLPGQFSPNCLRKETFDIQQCQIQASFLVHTSRENNMGQACFPDSRDSGMRVYHLNKRTNYLFHD